MKPIQTGTERSTAAAVMVLGSVSEVLKLWVRSSGASYLVTGGAAQNMSMADIAESPEGRFEGLSWSHLCCRITAFNASWPSQR